MYLPVFVADVYPFMLASVLIWMIGRPCLGTKPYLSPSRFHLRLITERVIRAQECAEEQSQTSRAQAVLVRHAAAAAAPPPPPHTYIHYLAMFTACERLCPYNRLVAKNPSAQAAIADVIYIVDVERGLTTPRDRSSRSE